MTVDALTPLDDARLWCLISQDAAASRSILSDVVTRERQRGRKASFVDGATGYFDNLSVRDNLALGATRWGPILPIGAASIERMTSLGATDLHSEFPSETTKAIVAFERSGLARVGSVCVHRLGDRLNREGRDAFLTIARQRADNGCNVLFSTSTFRPDGLAGCDRLTILSGGEIVYDGAPSAVSRLRARLLVLDRADRLALITVEITGRTTTVSTVDGLMAEWMPTLRDVFGQRSFAVRLNPPGLPRQIATSAPEGREHGPENDLAHWLGSDDSARTDSVNLSGHNFVVFPIVVENSEIGALVVEDSPEANIIAMADITEVLADSYATFTARRRTVQASRDLSRAEAVTTMVGGIAHDLNNRLQIMIGSLDLIDRTSDRTELDDHLATLRMVSMDSRAFVSKLLAFSRVAQLDRQPLALNAVTRDAAEIVSSGTPNVEIHVMASDVDPIVEGDPVELRNVFINLLLNAASAVPQPGGRIEVQSRVNDSKTVSVAVIDNGHGIPSDFVDRIFQPFVSSGTSPGRTGLGLAVARSIVEEHGGHIQIRSTSPAGTTVVVTIPYTDLSVDVNARTEPECGGAEQPDPPAATTAEVSQLPRRQRGTPTDEPIRVLVVDDDPDVRQVIADMLEWAGYLVDVAASGAEAVAIFEDRPDAFAVAIVDQVMEAMSGDEVLASIRGTRPDLKTISLSGYRATDGDIRHHNADVLLTKPVTIDQIVASVRGLLDAESAR